jgi:sugar O-acyltransferase (sialic acid O-acetyltransferase NeuD family)
MPKPKPLLIFPCNGNGLEALDCLGDAYTCVGFVDDTPAKQGTQQAGHPVLSRAALAGYPDAQVLAVPGGPNSYLERRSIIASLGLDDTRWAQVVHPRASIGARATLGRNILIMAGVVVTSNATIGSHVCLLPNTVVHHDASVGAYSLLGSGVVVAGHTSIGENCYIGSGSSVMNGLTLGDKTLVGLGSTVIRSCAAGSTLVGNPARTLR